MFAEKDCKHFLLLHLYSVWCRSLAHSSDIFLSVYLKWINSVWKLFPYIVFIFFEYEVILKIIFHPCFDCLLKAYDLIMLWNLSTHYSGNNSICACHQTGFIIEMLQFCEIVFKIYLVLSNSIDFVFLKSL